VGTIKGGGLSGPTIAFSNKWKGHYQSGMRKSHPFSPQRLERTGVKSKSEARRRVRGSNSGGRGTVFREGGSRRPTKKGKGKCPNPLDQVTPRKKW